MVVGYSKKEIEDLIDGKLPFSIIHRMLSNFKDPNRFDTYIEILQERVSWDELILLPYGLHLYIVRKQNLAAIRKTGSLKPRSMLEAQMRSFRRSIRK